MSYPVVVVVEVTKYLWAISRGRESDDSGSRASDLIAIPIFLISGARRDLVFTTTQSSFYNLKYSTYFRNSLLIAPEDGNMALHRHSMFLQSMMSFLDLPGSGALQKFIAKESQPGQAPGSKLLYPDLAVFIADDTPYRMMYKPEIINFLFEAAWSSIEGHK